MANILVTGGAGYIGSHACKALREAGFTPVTFDDFSTGWREAVQFGPLVNGTLLSRSALDLAFQEYKPDAVLHFAALSLVGQSIVDPGKYWRENINGSLNLIEAAVAAGCKYIVFSSTCATYGEQDGVVLSEITAQRPLNSYGASKRSIEEMLIHFSASTNLEYVIFRYFNVAGADPGARIGEQHLPETHLIPLVLDVIAGKRPALTVFGTDYATPDGTCIRDYVHVCDLVEAHVLGLRHLMDGRGSDVFCLGTGHGFSVREVIRAAEHVTGGAVPLIEGLRRPGDAAALVSGSTRAAEVLGWRPQRNLSVMIADAWRWHQSGWFEN